MDSESLLQGTANYVMGYDDFSSRFSPDSSSPGDHERMGILEALQDPDIQAAARRRAGRESSSDSWTSNDRSQSLQQLGRLGAEGFISRATLPTLDNCEVPSAPEPPYHTSVMPPFTVTTSNEDFESDDEEETSDDVLEERRRRDYGSRLSQGPDEEEDDVLEHFWGIRYAGRYDLPPPPRARSPVRRPRNRRELPGRITLSDPGEGSIPERQRELKLPHATFFIDKDSSKVSIKFDPPV